ncbi:hypothetical protein KAU11_10740 [Candidatus Babeliales bacterium]|nr:hypothetical protein [Candidatus Babeliales bacterium]
MIIKFNKETVTYRTMLNGEPVICEIEQVKDNNVSLKITPESYPNSRGSLNEFGNSISLSSASNKVSAANSLKTYLTELGGTEFPTFNPLDFTIKESNSWTEEGVDVSSFPIRVVIDKDSVLQNYSSFIEGEKAKGYPVAYKDTYVVLYVTQILQDHRTILEADINTFIEE